MKNIKTDNELIAEFMGEEISSVSANFGESIRVFVLPRKPISERKTGRPVEAKYDTSWDWLMPVCKKWDNIYRNDTMLSNRQTDIYEHYLLLCDRLDNAVSTYDIEPTYRQLVHNIKWYNQQNNGNNDTTRA